MRLMMMAVVWSLVAGNLPGVADDSLIARWPLSGDGRGCVRAWTRCPGT